MKLADSEIAAASIRMEKRLKGSARATNARYVRATGKVVVTLNNGLDLSFPSKLAQGLKGAKAADLSIIELTPSGLGLHWPKLDADLYLPALMEGIFGSKTWMARELGRAGGQAISTEKQAAARANGKLGGRPRKAAAA